MHDDRNETPDERADRNLTELLQELRVALPGVQVLFAFLLAVPFQNRFGEATPFQRNLYLFTLLSAAAASALLISPTAYHRLNFQRRDKPHIVQVAQRMTIAGLAALALSMTCAVVLVTDWLFDIAAVVVVGVAVALAFLVLWLAMPLLRRRKTSKLGSSRRRVPG